MASALNTLSAAIEAALRDAVDPDDTGLPVIVYENQTVDPPATFPWVKVAVLYGEAQRVTGRTSASATKGNHVTGVLSVSVFDQPGAGAGPMDDVLDDVRDAFNATDVGIAHFGAASGPRTVPGVGLAQRVVTIPFLAVEA